MANLNVSGISNTRVSPGLDTENISAAELKTSGLSAGDADGASSGNGANFSDILRNSLEEANVAQVQADTAVKELVAGRSKNIHETMLAIEKADTSLKLMMQVRNKIIDAYREIMRMQV